MSLIFRILVSLSLPLDNNNMVFNLVGPWLTLIKLTLGNNGIQWFVSPCNGQPLLNFGQ